jgi:hypothetical protein
MAPARLLLLASSASALIAPSSPTLRTAPLSANAELEALAKAQNPVIGFFDPLNLSEADLWGAGEQATIGWLREAEIKHGRIAMAGFVGYLVHAQHITFPWKTLGTGAVDMSSMTPPEQWDAVPENAKWQIFTLIGFLEIWREGASDKHYMEGGRPGDFPSFKNNFMSGFASNSKGNALKIPHGVPLDLWDPLNTLSKKTPEQRATSLNAEVNNGRLAMLGLFGFFAESKLPGSVPALQKIGIPAYKGDYMAPFEADWHLTLFKCGDAAEAFCGAGGRDAAAVIGKALPLSALGGM